MREFSWWARAQERRGREDRRDLAVGECAVHERGIVKDHYGSLLFLICDELHRHDSFSLSYVADASNSSTVQTWFEIPASIAGVTRRV